MNTTFEYKGRKVEVYEGELSAPHFSIPAIQIKIDGIYFGVIEVSGLPTDEVIEEIKRLIDDGEKALGEIPPDEETFLYNLAILNKETGEIRTPKSVYEWGEYFELGNRIIAQEDVAGFWVSTVFLAMDHNFNDDRGPLWFETMVFRSGVQHPLYDQSHAQLRYATLEEARAGHERVKQMILTGEIGE